MCINITEHKIESAHTAEIACPIFTNRLHVLADLSKREGMCFYLNRHLMAEWRKKQKKTFLLLLMDNLLNCSVTWPLSSVN